MVGIVASVVFAVQVGGAEPAVITRARLDPRAEVSFRAIVVPETVYVGGWVSYELGVFIANEMRQRLRRNPEFVPPELRSVLAYDLKEPTGPRLIERDGRTYEAHVFRRALFPVAPGRIDIPPARLTYAVPLGPSFFSREETRSLRSEPVSFVAIPPPRAGRPASWRGAVGDLAVSAAFAGRSPRVGNPSVVTLRVSGAGNVHLWPRPELDLEWATVVTGAERVRVDSLARTVRGAKEFDFLVTPMVEGRVVVPVIAYSVFDPDARSYRIARTRPETLSVGEGSLAALDTTVGASPTLPTMTLRPDWSTPLPDAPDRYIWFWLAVAATPIPAMIRAWRRRPRRHRALTPADAMIALGARKTNDVAEVHHALRRALEMRLPGVPLPWADPAGMRRALRHRGVTDATIARAQALLARLDGTAYGGDATPIPDAAQQALAVLTAIDNEARGARLARRARTTSAVALAMVSIGCAAFAQESGDARSLFTQAHAAYAAGDAAAAADAFFAAANITPGSANAWANAGTASWAAGDTGRAVVGWQRALRLNPLDTETRDRLARVGADAGSGRAAVWPIPRRVGAWLAITLWLFGWMQLARARKRTWPAVAIACSIPLGIISWAHGARLNDTSLAVVRDPIALRTLPALGSETGATPLTGEIVRVQERRGVWARISAGDGRDGWIDGARLLDLDGRPVRD